MAIEYIDYPKARKVLELYKMIRNGTAQNQQQLSKILEVSPSTIKKYIAELKNIWEADIVYRGKRYVLINEGILGSLKMTQPLSHYDVFILLTTLMQVYPFMETKFEIIKAALLSMLTQEEKKKFEIIFKTEKKLVEANLGVENTIKKAMESILSHNKVSVTYRNGEGKTKCSIYQPYTLACDQGKYYLIAKRDEGGYVHHLRLDQIYEIEKCKDKFKPVTDLVITEYLKRTWYMYTGEETKVRVRFTQECKKVVLERNMSIGQILEENEESFVYEFICNGTKGIKLWLMGFMENAEILEPVELREEIKEHIREMMKTYQ